ncbi:acetoacetate--CoA ligase [Magnetospirillum fulvum]|uniref:Acetoacetyl-CoA synthetase n=1 Tax=Magnetospirillum fulvum TaxID=1082 RepID=A0A1H6J978_MAGFU|nr:acetoacetate--CoA ligase [Magnetospirillum fulvum]SEH58625.1 acetoacetyl-CoA synthetase [Magnetospirillum fulvum]
MSAPLWQPSPDRIAASRLTAFIAEINRRHALALADMAGLWRWSVERPDLFWDAVWSFCGVIGDRGEGPAVDDPDRLPGAVWFPEARLNFAENLLRRRDDGDALVFWGEDQVRRRVSHAELYTLVARLAAAMRSRGIGPGDRVAGVLPNLPEAIAAMLAAASLGAVWSSASPDFGVQGIVDRFGQIAPKLLIAADGYWYNGKRHDIRPKLAGIRAGLPSVETLVVVPYLDARPDLADLPGAVGLDAFLGPAAAGEIAFERLPFDHPLYILYSSGTTGLPKCIRHGAGGVLVQHLKEHQLHSDIRPGDRIFYFTTCGWMMWNWLASGLASGATLMLYDGSPSLAQGAILFDYAEAEAATFFGTSAKWLDAIAKAGLRPRDTHRLECLRTIASTGSVLAPDSFDYVYDAVKSDVCLSSISGGTDIVSCFMLGDPTGPVWRGEVQCRGLGMRVEVFDPDGVSLRSGQGELVCTRAFPCVPLGFGNDPDGHKFHAAYFQRFPGVWTHGDWVELTEHGGLIVSGRSDATLNPGGVRIGTAEIYRQVETLDEVVEALAVAQNWANDVRVVLFVRLKEGLTLDSALIDRIKQRIRDNTTPRHVPAKVIQVSDLPRTRSGKLVELAVRDLVNGRTVANREALANPEALDLFVGIEDIASP